MEILATGGITTGWGSQWETLANAINSYYGGGVDSAQYQRVVQMLNSGEYTMEEMDDILGNIPEFSRTYNSAGELVQVSWKGSATTSSAGSSVASEINSNVATATKSQFETAQTITKDAQTSTVTIGDTLTKYKTGQLAPTTAKGIFSSAIAGITAAGVGISLAKTIDGALYNALPAFWDENGMSALNPETWSYITAGENDFGSALFNLIFGIDPETNNPTAYIDETTFAYMTAYMISQGVFDIADEHASVDDTTGLPQSVIDALPLACSESLQFTGTYISGPGSGTDPASEYATITGTSPVYYYVLQDGNSIVPFACSLEPFTLDAYTHNQYGQYHSTYTGSKTTYNNKEFYYCQADGGTTVDNVYYYTVTPNLVPGSDRVECAYVILFGAHEEPQTIPGIIDQPGGKRFNISGISDPSDINSVLNALKAQYPELWQDRYEVSPDGETVIKYIPISLPTGGTGNQPTTSGATQTDPEVDISGKGSNATDELIKTLIDLIQNTKSSPGMESDTDSPAQPVNPNPTDTGSGDTPTVVVPTGTAKSLFAIYNPEQSEINSFGAWLWSPAFVDQLLKLFNDPMQSIIGLHKIFAPPVISGTDTIHVGYLDSGVSSKVVGAQYVTVSCGSVNLSEYFGNVFDYDPFTDVQIYLPFIGIEKLNTGDVMRSSIEVVYHVDVITGACLAEIRVTRDLSGGTIYTYSGNCAVQYPISSGSYMGIVASIASIAGGVVGTIASGGALAPVAFGAVNGALNARTRVEHSGGFSGNAGAMGIKTPYLIITRPQTALADTFPMFNGYPANKSVIVGTCSGFVQFDRVHVENINATTEELSEIETLLQDGVIL